MHRGIGKNIFVSICQLLESSVSHSWQLGQKLVMASTMSCLISQCTGSQNWTFFHPCINCFHTVFADHVKPDRVRWLWQQTYVKIFHITWGEENKWFHTYLFIIEKLYLLFKQRQTIIIHVVMLNCVWEGNRERKLPHLFLDVLFVLFYNLVEL